MRLFPKTDSSEAKSILLTCLLGFSISLVLFTLLAILVSQGITANFDPALLQWINQYANPYTDAFFVAITQLGGVVVVSAVAALLIGYLLYKRNYPKALLVALGIGGAALINFILKGIFERARPDLWTWIITETNFSFPSGHSVASAALGICIVILLWRTKWRMTAVIGASLYVVVIGLSRMYLGVHFPTDILGGWLIAVAWMSLVTAGTYVYVLIRRTRTKAPE